MVLNLLYNRVFLYSYPHKQVKFTTPILTGLSKERNDGRHDGGDDGSHDSPYDQPNDQKVDCCMTI